MKRVDHYSTLQSYNKNGKSNNRPGPYRTSEPTPEPEPVVPQRNEQPQQVPPVNSGGNIRSVDSRQAYNLIVNPQHNTKGGIAMKVILICSASWCDPCKLLLPKMEELSRESSYRNISFLKVDCSNPTTLCPELRNLLNIDAVPIMYGFHGSKQINVVAGANISEIENMCDQLANMP